MNETILDTDILSFYLKGELNVARQFTNYLKEYSQFNISIITYYEILSGLKYKNAENKIQDFEVFVNNNSIINLSERSAEISANIYSDLSKNGITIGASDILIAGIAIENDLTLITNNEKHYSPIKGIRLENWTK